MPRRAARPQTQAQAAKHRSGRTDAAARLCGTPASAPPPARQSSGFAFAANPDKKGMTTSYLFCSPSYLLFPLYAAETLSSGSADFDPELLSAARAARGVFSLGARKAQRRAAVRAGFVDVRFPRGGAPYCAKTGEKSRRPSAAARAHTAHTSRQTDSAESAPRRRTRSPARARRDRCGPKRNETAFLAIPSPLIF